MAIFLALSPITLIVAVLTAKYAPQTYLVTMVIGGIIVLSGLALSMWSQWVLGKNWVGGVGLRKSHYLVMTGPYRFVQHPLYSGMLLSAFGIGVFSLNPLLFLSALSFFGAYAIRIYGENKLLRRKFKKKYEQYAANTGMLIPRIRRRC